MKLTKRQLKKLIKEELEEVAKNFHPDSGEPLTRKGREMCAKNPECKEQWLRPGTVSSLPNQRDKPQAKPQAQPQAQDSSKVASAIKELSQRVDELEEDFRESRLQMIRLIKAKLAKGTTK